MTFPFISILKTLEWKIRIKLKEILKQCLLIDFTYVLCNITNYNTKVLCNSFYDTSSHDLILTFLKVISENDIRSYF